MDGLPENLKPVTGMTCQGVSTQGMNTQGMACQRSLKSAISCVGVGLHSGQRVNLTLLPAAAGTGIVFRRTDLNADIPARWDMVADTRLCTLIASPNQPEARVGTIEHLMAAFSATGIDNAIVAVDGPEVPVFDGSAAPYIFLIDCAGVQSQPAPRPAIEILRSVRVEDGEAFAELRPYAFGLDMALSIDFAAAAIGRQALTVTLSEHNFRAELAHARTFTQRHEIEAMQAAGLARGGSLANAVVVDGDRVLNPEGLRSPDEFVRHKLLDAVGDLALAGGRLHARFVAHRCGHTLNNRLLRAVFADSAAWRLVWPEQAGRRDYGLARAA